MREDKEAASAAAADICATRRWIYRSPRYIIVCRWQLITFHSSTQLAHKHTHTARHHSLPECPLRLSPFTYPLPAARVYVWWCVPVSLNVCLNVCVNACLSV